MKIPPFHREFFQFSYPKIYCFFFDFRDFFSLEQFCNLYPQVYFALPYFWGFRFPFSLKLIHSKKGISGFGVDFSLLSCFASHVVSDYVGWHENKFLMRQIQKHDSTIHKDKEFLFLDVFWSFRSANWLKAFTVLDEKILEKQTPSFIRNLREKYSKIIQTFLIEIT